MSDEWIHVPPRRSRNRRAKQPTPASSVASAVASVQPSSTVAEIRTAHASFAAQWAELACAAQLRELVASIRGSSGSGSDGGGCVRVDKAVCLGVGSFDAESGWQARRKAHFQVLAFEQMVAGLQAGEEAECEKNTHKIQTLFQDPAFTAADMEFLAGRGHSVVLSPAGFAAIDSATLVFGVHLYADVYAQALAHSLPRVFVGTGWAAWDDARLGAAVKKPERIAEMEAAGWLVREFPQDEGYTFSSTVVYWRGEAEGEVEAEKPEPEKREPEVENPAPEKLESEVQEPQQSGTKPEPEPEPEPEAEAEKPGPEAPKPQNREPEKPEPPTHKPK